MKPLTWISLAVLTACGGADTSSPLLRQVPKSEAATEAAGDGFSAVLMSRTSLVVTAPFDARVTAVHVVPGQQVKAGAKLVSFDPTDLEARRAALAAEEKALRAEAAAIASSLGAARTKAQAQQRLARFGAAPQIDYTTAAADANRLAAELGAKSARADVVKIDRKVVENQLAQAVVVAPFDGIVALVGVKAGEAAKRHGVLARVSAPGDLVVKFAVPTSHDELERGQRVELTIDGRDKGNTGKPRTVKAVVERSLRQEPPINFTIVEAIIDDRDLTPDLRVAASGHVRIADARGEHQ